jgi:cytochrome c553
MSRVFFALIAFVPVTSAVLPVRAEDVPPAWAYVLNPPDFKPSPDEGQPRRVPDSGVTYLTAQTRDRFFAPDWHPADHPPMPDIVAHGRKPDVFACGFCHRADGPGGPENASLAGLPKAYFVQQMADFKSGLRGTSVPARSAPKSMISLSKAITDAEVIAAAEYFSALKPRTTLKVVETDTVPKTYVAGFLLADAKTGEREPIGARIIEVAEDLEQFENRDAHSQFIAYVPVGSVEKGRHLAAGGSNFAACTSCHGAELKGAGDIPGIAGRSPSSLMRQLYDINHGARAGPGSAPMKDVAAKLSTDEMLALVAYLATLPP